MPVETLFLQEFTKELVSNSRRFTQEIEITKENESFIDIPSRVIERKRELMTQNTMIKQPSAISEYFIQKVPVKKTEMPKVPVPKSGADYYNGIYFGKLISFIKDLGVMSVECPGPGEMINVKRYGQIKTVKIFLNNNEINEIINSFSQQTRIPRIGGFFKAISSGLVISAVDSKNGPRFIITKAIQYNTLTR